MGQKRRKHKKHRPHKQAPNCIQQPTLNEDKEVPQILNTTEPSEGAPKAASEKEIPMIWRVLRWIRETTFADFCLILFTAVLAGVGALQWDTLKGQMQMMGGQLDEMRIDQRPWLRIRPGDFSMPIDGNVWAPMTVTNTGKTPAKRVNGWIIVRAYPKDKGIDFRDPTAISQDEIGQGHGIPWTEFYTGVAFPNDPLPVNNIRLIHEEPKPHTTSFEVWTKDMKARFDRREFYLEVHGRFTYKDSHGTPHWTQFCATTQEVPVQVGASCNAYADVDENK